MSSCLVEALRKRRSYYHLDRNIPIDEERIVDFVRETVRNVPSAFNSQSSRLVLLLGDSHSRFWQAVCDSIKKIVPDDAYRKSEEKIHRSFASGYGTVLFYEDGDVISSLEREYPLYAKDFPIYSQQTSAMHQMVLWTLLCDAGLGASLQHYESLVEADCRRMFSMPDEWRLVAQMPFGRPLDIPGEKSFVPLDERIRILR